MTQTINVEAKWKELREELRARIDQTGESQSSIAKAIGTSPATLSQFLSGTYATPHKLFSKVEAYLHINESRQVAPKRPDFVYTSISSSVMNIITYCHIQGVLGCVYGDAGVGKTQAIFEYERKHPEAVVITASPAFSTQKGVSELLAESLRIQEGRSIRKIFKDIVGKLRDSGRVIIIDEAQHLTIKAIEHLRSISDESGVGMVFIGNEEVYTKMLGRGEAAFAQLFSRMAIRENVLTTRVKKEDVQLLFPMLGDEEQEFLLRIARSRWGVRGAVNVFVNSATNESLDVNGLSAMAKFMGIGA